MHLMCFLLLTFVHTNVSAFYDLTYYKKWVVITNATIKLAYNTRIIIGDNIESNGLEKVIKTIVDNEKEYNLDKMNLMIVVPEELNIDYSLPNFVNLEKINQSLYRQCMMVSVIETVLEIQAPKIDEAQTEFGDLDLIQLAEERRILTRIALKNIIKRAIDFENLANLIEERRINPTKYLQKKIKVRYEHGFSLSGMCRLIALFMSTKFPTFYIKAYETSFDGSNICTLRDGNTYATYREIEGEWWQVCDNNMNMTVQLLKEQLA